MMLWALLIGIPLMNWRLCAAYRQYLKMDHPVATVLTSQVLVLLTVVVVVAKTSS